MVVEKLSMRYNIDLRKKVHHSRWAEVVLKDERVILIQPLTYMNNSGMAVSSWVKKKGIDLKDILVILDDINLPLGVLRLRSKGSAGGHKGLTSIIEHLRSEEFARLRVGIGSPTGEVVNFVLDKFSKDEQTSLQGVVERASEACESWVHNGLGVTMNKFNTRWKGEN